MKNKVKFFEYVFCLNNKMEESKVTEEVAHNDEVKNMEETIIDDKEDSIATEEESITEKEDLIGALNGLKPFDSLDDNAEESDLKAEETVSLDSLLEDEENTDSLETFFDLEKDDNEDVQTEEVDKETSFENILNNSKDTDVLGILNDMKKEDKSNGLDDLQKLAEEFESEEDDESQKAFENLQKLARDIENDESEFKDFGNNDFVDEDKNLIGIDILDIDNKKPEAKNKKEKEESKVDIPMI